MSFTIDYKDKVVLVTGVSSGIGLGTAIEFAKAGAHVAGCSRKAAADTCAVAFRKAVGGRGGTGLIQAGRCDLSGRPGSAGSGNGRHVRADRYPGLQCRSECV